MAAGKQLAGYVRVSRKGDRDELRSPDFQRQAIQRFAATEGFAVEFFPPEIDVSGAKARRSTLDSIISKVKSGELAGVVVARLDRLSRLSPKDRVMLFEEIENSGGVVLSASEQLDPSTPEGRFAREVFLGVARMQWEKYRDGFEEAKAGAVEAGIPVHTREAVGLRTRADRRLEPDPDLAPIVREVFQRRARGEGPTALGRFLEAHGVRTSQGSSTWSKQAVYGLLASRIYLGELSYGRDRRYVNAKSHEPIVDLATWQAAQHPNGCLAPSRSSDGYLLAGIIRCRACGYCLQGTTSSRGKRIYRCTRRHAGGVCPAPAQIAAEVANDAAVAAFWELTTNLEAHATPDDGGRIRELEDSLKRAELGMSQWTSPEVQEAIGDLAEYADGLRERRATRDSAAEELGRARTVSSGQSLPVSTETLRGAWERMTTQERRELLKLRFDTLALGRDRSIVVYPARTAPPGLPRQGFRRDPELVPFPDIPSDARVLTL